MEPHPEARQTRTQRLSVCAPRGLGRRRERPGQPVSDGHPQITLTALRAISLSSARGASRLYGSTIGIAVVQVFFYNNTQAVQVALAKNLTPYRAAAHVTGSIARPGLAALNDMVTGQAAVIAVIDQFEILMFAMLIVSPLVLFLRKPRPANTGRFAVEIA